MALLHQAELRPTKPELLATWLPTRAWAGRPDGAAPVVERVGAYRFDDPDGEVGVETILVRHGGRLLQVPLTYRGHPAADLEPHLVGTMEHSVLGQRWVYDACGDPVYAAVLAATIRTGGTEAEEVLVVDGERRRRQPSVTVRGTGESADPVADGPGAVTERSGATTTAPVTAVDDAMSTRVSSPWGSLVVVRVLPEPGTAADEGALGGVPEGAPRLHGRWEGAPRVTLAALTA